MSSVTVGEQNMTPVAKWTRINADGTYESGNGWLRNSEGTWTFDEHEQAFTPTETNGLEDPYGAFSISITNEGEEMTWQREEEGMMVDVTLTKINELPKAPADAIQGLWDLESVHQNDEDITDTFDPDNQYYTFIRWDRIYMLRNSEGERKTGYWHMDGHRPEMTMIPHDEGEPTERWSVSVQNDNKLVMTELTESNQHQTLIFSRIDSFPQ